MKKHLFLGLMLLLAFPSLTMAVTDPCAPSSATLSMSPNSIKRGSTGTATWAGIATPTASDRIGMYAPGVADTKDLSWRYTTGTASGSVAFAIPNRTKAGTYELRLFANGGNTRLATSPPFKVTK